MGKKVNYQAENLEKNVYRLSLLSQSFNYLQVTLASPEQMRNCSKKYLDNIIIKGAVNTRYIKLYEKYCFNDLYSQEIFGPMKNWLCKCKKYNSPITNRLIGLICPYCKVEITSSRVRRYRTGYIDLFAPIIHTWYINLLSKLIYSILKIILLVNKREDVLKENEELRSSVLLDPDEKIEEIIFGPHLIECIYLFEVPFYLDENELSKFFYLVKEFFYENFNFYSKKIGPEFFLDFLKTINYYDLIMSLTHNEINDGTNMGFQKRMLKNYFFTKSRPEWIILTSLPVLPPSTRPFIKIYKQSCDTNEKQESGFTIFYRSIMFANKLISTFDIDQLAISSHLLQNRVDQLLDNSRLPEDIQLVINDRVVTSLTENFEGKFGRFRYNILGKRTNFSGRSVIITGPTLHLYQCQLPYKIALTLFMPHFISFLKKKLPLDIISKIDWEDLILNECFFFYKILGILIQNYFVMLNRAPTLHRFNVQSFSPILTLNKAIGLHPLVCTGFNADFDGDQMAVHLPLYNASQIESYLLHSPQVLTPANGDPILKPSQDIVIGCCYLSIILKKNRNIFFKYFDKKKDIYLLYSQKKIELHMPILVNLSLNNLCITKLKNDLILKNNNFKILHYKTKIIKFVKSLNFIYLFLDCGIILVKKLHIKKYTILKFYIKTTPGRIFFGDFIDTLLK